MNKVNIRLYWGENYCPKPRIVEEMMTKAVLKSLKRIHQFPGEVYDETRKIIAESSHVDINQIILGNGIDNMINLISHCYVEKGTIVAGFSPSYNIYKIAANNHRGLFKSIRVNIGQSFSAQELFGKIKTTKLFFIAYPNNPTGHYCINVTELEELLVKYKGIIIVDECYYGIGNKTVVNLLNKHSNLIILRSFSKGFGLAGLRLGYLISNKNIINQLSKFHSEIELDPISIFTHLVSQSILPCGDLLLKKYNQFKRGFIEKLKSIKKIKVIPTWTSFVLIELSNFHDADAITSKLAERGIFLKKTKDYDNFPKNILMFAVPEKKYWNYFIKSLTKVINL